MSSPPVLVLTGRAATGTAVLGLGEKVNILNFVSLGTTDGDPILYYEFYDSNASASSAYGFVEGGSIIQGVGFRINAAVPTSSMSIVGGSFTSNDVITIRAFDKDGYTEVQFTVRSRGANTGPVVSATGLAVDVGSSISAVSMVLAYDAEGDAATSYQFFDDAAGGGYFTLNGQVVAARTVITVSAADLGNLRYFGADGRGTETLEARAYDGQTWGAWTTWNQVTRTPGNEASVVSPGSKTVGTNQWVRATDLGLVVTDANGDLPIRYTFSNNTGIGDAQLWYANTYFPQGSSITVEASDLANLWVKSSANTGTTTMRVSVYDGFVWSGMENFNIVTRGANAAPTVAATGATVAVNASVAASTLITTADVDGDAIARYRFWDPAGGGVFKLSGTAQASGQNIEFAAADMANLTYAGGATAGRETLWVQVYDGQAWSAWASWSQQTVRNTNTVSVVGASNRNLNLDQWIKASDLAISVTDADGDAPVQYRFTDLNVNTTSARMWMGGIYKAQGDIVTINAADLGNLWIQGSPAAALDGFTVEVNDGYGWSNAAAFNVVTRQPNRAPVVSSSGASVAVGGSALATSLISVSDADGDTPTLYRFWDPAGGGVFKLSGVTQASGQNLDVAAADIANLRYHGSTPAGRETLWAQVYDGTDWSAWAQWSQQTVRNGNTVSVVSAANRNLSPTQWIKASDLAISVTDADGDAPTQYRFTDGNSAAGSAQLWFGGSFVAQGGTALVSAADLGALWLQGATANGTDGFTVEVNDGIGWSNAAAFNVVTRPPNRAPVAAGAGTSVAVGGNALATSLISVTDADGDTPTLYRFWDPSGGGVFKLNGVAQAANQNLDVAAADIANLRYYGSATAGRETLWAQVYDGTDWSAWTSWSQQTVRNGNTVSVVSAANRNLTASQWIRASELSITVTDADGDTPTQYRFTDGNNAAGSAQLWQAGGFVAQGGTVTVSAGDLANLWIQGANTTITDGFTVEVNDGFGWSNAAAFNVATRGPNRVPVITAANPLVHVGEAIDASRLFNVTDADGDTITQYVLWDPVGNGYFTRNGATQASGSNLAVTAAQLGEVRYVGGASIGTPENLWVQAYDGTAWSAWTSVAVTSYLPPPSLERAGTVGNDTIGGELNAVHYGGPGNDAFSNPAGVAYAAFIGGAGDDTYTVNTGGATSITFVLDADGTGGGGDTLNLPGFDITDANSGAGILDGRTLVLGVGNHYVVVPDWQDALRGGIDTFTNGTQTWTRSQFLALLTANAGLVDTGAWEDIGFSTADMRQTVDAWVARTTAVNQTIRANGALAAGAAYLANPPGGGYAALSRGDDINRTADYSSGGFVLLTRQGNDVLGSPTFVGTTMGVVGGAGADQYLANGNQRLVILEDGDSTGDSLVLSVDGLRNQAVIVDGRHLLIRNSMTDSGGRNVTVLLDWTQPANRIENVTVNTYASIDYGVATNLLGATSYTYDQFKSTIDSLDLPQVTWEQLGGSTATWNQFITQTHANAQKAANNIAPTVASANATIGYRTRSALASTFSANDTDGDTLTQYNITAIGNARIWLGETQTWTAGVTGASAANLATYRAVGDGTGASQSFTIQVFDGWDWSAETTVTVNTLADQTPVTTSTGQALAGAERRALAAFFNVTDGDNDAIARYEVGTTTGAILWRDGVRQDNATLTIESVDLSHYQVSSNGVANGLSFGVRAYDGYAWGAQAAVTATVANPLPPPPDSGFGLQGPAKALGTVGTVAAGVLIAQSESFRLDSIVHIDPNQAASILGYEFQAIGSNAGWAQGAYIQRESQIETAYPGPDTPIDYFTTSLYPQAYLHARFHTHEGDQRAQDTEFWRVRAETAQDVWTDWTSFYVTTTPRDNTSFLPVDNAPANGRAITVGATPAVFDDWVGAADQDAYTFSVASAGTLHLDFSNLYDSVTLRLENLAGGAAQAGTLSGAINAPYASAATVASGGSATYALAPGDYRFTVRGALNPAYLDSVVGNTTYHLAASYQ